MNNNYSKFWQVYRSISKYSRIRSDEAEFIEATLRKLEERKIAAPDYLYDLGCGDGRISSFLGGLRPFRKIFLFDTSDSALLAEERLKASGLNVATSMGDLDVWLSTLNRNSILLSIGVVNFFPDQRQILQKLIGNRPKIVFLAVTGFSVCGNIYKGLNIIRGSRIISELINSLLGLLEQNLKVARKEGSMRNKFFLILIKSLEPFVASKIYRLKELEYKSFFEANGYRVFARKELGLCKWLVFVESQDE